MRYLLTSLIFLLLMSCGSYSKSQHFQSSEIKETIIINPYFSNPEKDYVYKANIEVYNNSFGGIFIVKKISAQEHRIVFTTEMGNKLFDFSFKENEFKVNSILDELDRKILINILEKDFRVLITKTLKNTANFTQENTTIYKAVVNNKPHYYYKKDHLNKIIKTKGRKEKITYIFSKISDNIAKEINIIHNNIKLKISLKSIN